MSDSFKAAIRGYDKHDVDSFITQMMENYDASIDELNSELSKRKDENTAVHIQIAQYKDRKLEQTEGTPDKNLQMRSRILEGKIKEKNSIIKKANDERRALEVRIEKEVAQKTTSADDVLNLMEKKRTELVNVIEAFESNMKDKSTTEAKKASIINNINMIEEKIEQSQENVLKMDSKLMETLEDQSKENEKMILMLKGQMDSITDVDQTQDLDKEKSQIADIILEAQLKANDLINQAMKERESRVVDMQLAVLAEEKELELIEKRLVYIKDTVNYTLSKNIENLEYENSLYEDRLIQFEAL